MSQRAMEKQSQKDRKRGVKQETKAGEQKIDTCPLGRRKVSNKTVITGGAGHFGFTLGRALAKSGTDVVLYDIDKPIWEIPQGVRLIQVSVTYYDHDRINWWQLIQADVRQYEPMFAACEGADCVIHAAAYGMSGSEQLHKKRIQAINIGGTNIVLEVCKKQNVPRLVYTSTVNVVFAGQYIFDGDEESVPYYPLNKHTSEYSRTKSIAEQTVLAANGSRLAGGGKLYTCAIRSPGIYGPDEQRHMPRLALNIERGLFSVRFGDPGPTMNWVHVKNLVQAHILAAEALTPEKNYIAGGQAYFINDGEKVNLFDFLGPLFDGLGVRKPWIRAPVCFVSFAGFINELIHYALWPFVEFTPMITRHEVYNVSSPHMFKIDKARTQLGYSPKKYSFADCVDHYLKTKRHKKDFFLLKCFLFQVLVIGLILLAIYHREVSTFLLDTWVKYRVLLG